MERYAKNAVKLATSEQCAEAGGSRAMNEMEQETLQDNTRKDIELVSINSIQLNKNCSVLTTNLKMSAGKTI